MSAVVRASCQRNVSCKSMPFQLEVRPDEVIVTVPFFSSINTEASCRVITSVGGTLPLLRVRTSFPSIRVCRYAQG